MSIPDSGLRRSVAKQQPAVKQKLMTTHIETEIHA